METHAVSFLQENGVVAHFLEQSVAVMEFTAVQMDTLVIYLLEPVVEKAKVYLCYQSCQHQRKNQM